MTLELAVSRFPHFAQARTIKIHEAKAIVTGKFGGAPAVATAPGETIADLSQATWAGEADPGPWTIGTTSDPRTIADIFIVVAYTV
jgi:hypothetical protein